ncbi:hypothetical protein D047_3926A, partial [Vibrio parahaemolyticus VPTS-2010_2]|jgi:tripeptide aminopeptidase
MPTF